LTTYRRISAEAAAVVTRHLGLKGKSPTEQIPLVGAGGDLDAAREKLASAGFPREAAAAAIGRYGAEATRLIDLASGNTELLTPLSDGQTTMAEVVHAVRSEAASTVADFTLRRTRLAWLTTDHGRKDQEAIAGLMAVELGWPADETARQIGAHEAELSAEGL
jgi:glycerol-3-phosphate dehydrogenase